MLHLLTTLPNVGCLHYLFILIPQRLEGLRFLEDGAEEESDEEVLGKPGQHLLLPLILHQLIQVRILLNDLLLSLEVGLHQLPVPFLHEVPSDLSVVASLQ